VKKETKGRGVNYFQASILARLTGRWVTKKKRGIGRRKKGIWRRRKPESVEGKGVVGREESKKTAKPDHTP